MKESDIIPRTIELRDDAGAFKTMDAIEREAIAAAILESAGNMSKAARLLDIGRSSLYRKVGER